MGKLILKFLNDKFNLSSSKEIIPVEFIFLCLTHFFSCSDEIYIAPSGVQKERILPEDLFIQNMDGDDILVPPEYKKYANKC